MVLQVIPVFSRKGYPSSRSISSVSSSSSTTSGDADSSDDEQQQASRVGLYVQEALRQDSVRTPRNTAALLCGMR